MTQNISSSRRSFIKTSSTLAAVPFVGALGAMHARIANAAGFTQRVIGPYGPVAPVKDLTTGLELIKLPAGFSYKSYGWTGDMMTDGQITPGSHDGMGVIVTRRVGRSQEMVLCRNHERGNTAAAIVTSRQGYDLVASGATPTLPGGGNTNLVFRDGNWVSSVGSLSGTLVNCAGGVTPWGTWLSCEETVSNRESVGGRKHGYVFEVPADPMLTTGEPIIGMGRFQHEAAAVDPVTGFVYETHDATRLNGIYRYEPLVTTGALGSLIQGGTLKMAKIKTIITQAPTSLSTTPPPQAVLLAPQLGDSYELEWVTIDNPDADPVPNVPANYFPYVTGVSTPAGPFKEGFDKGGAQLSRGEGIWYWNRKMYIVDTSGGANTSGNPGGEGTVWELDCDTQVLTCVFVVPAGQPNIGNNADNICISPKGGILLQEDGGTHNFNGTTVGCRMMGLLPDGNTFTFAENNLTPDVRAMAAAMGKPGNGSQGGEFAGGTFSPDGRVLFVNIQTPGITFAISGPWGAGPL